ncbi:MAG: cellulase family glycosylhydrolase [Planctomycetes bacterium]|nr:cellulase family glycosylhydrolase [Planctomycetota bacterium]
MQGSVIRRGVLLATLGACALSLAARGQEPGPLSTRGPWLVDDEGRVVILHGANASNRSKSPPFEPDLAEGDTERWQKMGFSVVRLLVLWEGVEPERGRYDDGYLARIGRAIDRFGGAGVRVILDMHQDLWSRHLFGGDGAPEWAVEKGPYKPLAPWWLNYDSPAVRANFDRFWTSADLQEHYALAWERVAKSLGTHPAVIGYDLMNEPHPGTARPGEFERERYVPWLARLADRLQAITPDRIVFLEPVTLNPTPIHLYAGLAGPRRVWAPHYYDPLVETTMAYRSPFPARVAIGLFSRRALAAGFPLFFGEWGMVQGWDRSADYVRDMASLFDRYRAGWCWWAWDREDGAGFGLLAADGSLGPAGKWLVRAYPLATAGTPRSWRCDPAAGTFEMTWTNDSAIQLPTEIVLPPDVFGPRGGRVARSDGVASTEYDASRWALLVTASGDATECRIAIERE